MPWFLGFGFALKKRNLEIIADELCMRFVYGKQCTSPISGSTFT